MYLSWAPTVSMQYQCKTNSVTKIWHGQMLKSSKYPLIQMLPSVLNYILQSNATFNLLIPQHFSWPSDIEEDTIERTSAKPDNCDDGLELYCCTCIYRHMHDIISK